MRQYVIWNDQANRLVSRFASEEDALVFVQESIAAFGVEHVSGWSLLFFKGDDNEAIDDLGSGQDLARRALATVSVTRSSVA